MNPVNISRTKIRTVIDLVAKLIDRYFGKYVTPDVVTWVGFLAHFIIGYFIVSDMLVLAAFLLVFFGLFDALDGSLARLQKVSSSRGMFLDATTDRFKEVILYASLAWYLPSGSIGQVLCVAACGIALSISYVKAKGESAIATNSKKLSHQEINRMFHDGLAAFEVRIFIIVVGLLFGQIILALSALLILGLVTLIQRFIHIYRVV